MVDSKGNEPEDQDQAPEEGPELFVEDILDAAPADPVDDPVEEATASDLEAELLRDLQRIQAEYINYRKRVERDREANRELVIAEVIRTLLPAFDDLDRAEAHGDLADGPFVLISQKLHAAVEKFGLTKIGEKGEVFDPNLHEALVQLPNPDVTVNTVGDVIEPGYLLGERLIRPAKVAVFVPTD
jgi:molecular chaperone GrpE